WVGTLMIFLLALIQCVIYGWSLGIRRGAELAHEGAHLRIPFAVQLLLKYVAPVYLIAIFIGSCTGALPAYVGALAESPVALFSVLFILVVLAFLLLLIYIAGIRWQREGRYDFVDGVAATGAASAADPPPGEAT
ncbi:MAG: sodium:calcium symporter, partial [Planctomycetota bacterium]